jgi:DNA-binding Lrp family transcriptional regulator
VTEARPLTKGEERVLKLIQAGHSEREVAKAIRMSRSTVHDRIEYLRMRGLLPHVTEAQRKRETAELKEEPEGGPLDGGAVAPIAEKSAGAAASSVIRRAAERTTEEVDVFLETGELIWLKFKELAEREGYSSIYSWLATLIEYWQQGKDDWQAVLDELKLARQRVRQLEIVVEDFEEGRESFQELLDAVMVLTLSGRRLSAEELREMRLAMQQTTQPRVAESIALPGGR